MKETEKDLLEGDLIIVSFGGVVSVIALKTKI